MVKFKFLKHTADVKFRAYGKDVDKAFENSALAMFNSMYSGKVGDKIKKKVKVKGNGKDSESLLYNFLEELLILLDSKNFFVSKLKVKINGNSLSAEVVGDDAGEYSIGLDVKAVTYNEMFVKKIKDLWVCQVVLDV